MKVSENKAPEVEDKIHLDALNALTALAEKGQLAVSKLRGALTDAELAQKFKQAAEDRQGMYAHATLRRSYGELNQRGLSTLSHP